MKTTSISNNVIILGGNHHNALGIIRSLGETNIKVYYIAIDDAKKNYVVKSKYLKGYWVANNQESLLNILFSNFGKNKQKTIIIPSDDSAINIIEKNSELLSEFFIYPKVNYEQGFSIRNLMDKMNMLKLAEKHGFHVPKSVLIDLKNTNVFSKGLDISYPCIIKPIKSIEGNKSDITIVHSYNELKSNLQKLMKKYSKIFIQEYIHKEKEFGVQGIVTTNDKVIIPGVIEKIRVSKIAPGSTTYGKLLKNNELIDIKLIENLLLDIGYRGIFDIELMFSNGKIYFIEVNFRNGAYGYAYTKAGVNLPKLWCLDISGNDIFELQKAIKKEVYFINEFADFRNVLYREINLFKWLIQFLKSDVYLLFNSKDIKPFLYKLFNI